MCVILICKETKPSPEILLKCEKENKHGIGIAWINKNKKRAEYIKGIALEQLNDLVEDLPLPYCIHFREASIGKINPLLCHPFEVTKTSKLRLCGYSSKLLMHNGTINHCLELMVAAKVKVKKEEFNLVSDSRILAMIMGKNNDDTLLTTIEKGRFVLLDGKRDKIIHKGDFTEEDGILYSNMKWKWGNSYNGNYHYTYANGNYESSQSNFQKGFEDINWNKNSKLSRKERKRLRRQILQNKTSSNRKYNIKPGEYVYDESIDDFLCGDICYICKDNLSMGRVTILEKSGVDKSFYTCYQCSLKYYKTYRQHESLDENTKNKYGENTRKILGLPNKEQAPEEFGEGCCEA